MKHITIVLGASLGSLVLVSAFEPTSASAAATPSLAASGHDVMESAFCADCHPAIFAEHQQSTHGRAFSDAEVRLATGRFAHNDCIICHTPRPIFETGVGQNPRRRHYGLEDGSSCMTCHWKPDYDYDSFAGGAQCTEAFHPEVGSVEACASCHRNHGTPYQWERSPLGKAADTTCMDCHMAEVERAVAVGGPVRRVKQHVFPGSRSETQVRRAYRYTAAIEGNTAVITVKNKGVGHNFPTELKQRSVESLVIVRNTSGDEVARSRMIFRDPYKRPYGMELPVNTQIPSGESRSHRVPIGIADGTIETKLFFKLYYPIDDYHSDLSRVLETRVLPFRSIDPSSEPVETEVEITPVAPEGIDPELASAANLVDFARPAIGTVEIDVPAGDTPEDIAALIGLFQFPVPQGNKLARQRLAEIGMPAVPALIDALGSWDNKTYNQAMTVLQEIGNDAHDVLVAAMEDERLYVRLHGREMAARMGWRDDASVAALERGLSMPGALDRASAAEVIGRLGLMHLGEQLDVLLEDSDPDVLRAAAMALAAVRRTDAVPRIEQALREAHYDETRYSLSLSLAQLGSPTGIPVLLDGLEHRDDLIREAAFEALFLATGQHFGFDALAPRPDRLASISLFRGYWAKHGGAAALLPPDRNADPIAEADAWHLVKKIGGNDYLNATDADSVLEEELVAMGRYAVPSLILGLKYPPGFAIKRAALIRALGRIGDRRAAPALAAALRDPVLQVAAWSAWALEGCGDKQVIPALRRYEQRLRTAIGNDALPANFGPGDPALAQSARTRMLMGDDSARTVLAGLLLSNDRYTRRLAIGALEQRYDDDRDFDPDGEPDQRREAAMRWID
jgi:HEAT repeat protein